VPLPPSSPDGGPPSSPFGEPLLPPPLLPPPLEPPLDPPPGETGGLPELEHAPSAASAASAATMLARAIIQFRVRFAMLAAPCPYHARTGQARAVSEAVCRFPDGSHPALPLRC
jgi:hypothetical protein